MLEAGSVAVIGASGSVGSVGHQLIRQLVVGGFGGRVHPVNPRYDRIEGLDCASSIAEVGPVDLAVIAVGNERLEAQVAAAIEAGARSLALFASCHGTASDGSELAARLGAMATEAAVPVCGGNGMGFVNLERRLRVSGFFQPWGLEAGGVTFLSHSGSLFSAMLHNHRGLAFNLVVSTGNELATTMDQYLSHAVGLQSTSVIGLFLETVRRPDHMAAALASADVAGIPVVALKVGRTDRSRASVATHSAALAGEYAGFEAFAAAHGVHLVDTMDEMADSLQLFSAGRAAAPGGLGSVHDSGGERSLLIDTADRVGVPLARIGADTRRRLTAILDPGLEAENPVDAWGTGRDGNDVFGATLSVLADDPAVGVLVFCVDLTTEETPDTDYTPVVLGAAAATTKPVAVLANLAGAVDGPDALRLTRAGVPVLRGTETGLRAIGHLLAERDRRARPSYVPGSPPPEVAYWRERLHEGSTLSEAEGLALLSDFGITVATGIQAHDAASAVAAADRLGYPVVMKTAAGVAHKSDVGGVVVGIGDPREALAAYGRLASIGSGVLVQSMAPTGVEISVGLTRDEQFGPVVVVAAGGVLVEMMADRAVALPPFGPDVARSLIGRLRVRPLLDGFRGGPPVDVEALVAAVCAVGQIGHHLGDVIDSLDINPFIVHPDGCVAVDALVVPRG
jgi:acetate---CoA ligase (ADP-forming)